MSWGVRVSVWRELHSLILLNAQFQIRDFHLRFTLLFKLLYYCLIIILNPYSLFPLIFGVHSNKKQLNVFDWMFLESSVFERHISYISRVSNILGRNKNLISDLLKIFRTMLNNGIRKKGNVELSLPVKLAFKMLWLRSNGKKLYKDENLLIVTAIFAQLFISLILKAKVIQNVFSSLFIEDVMWKDYLFSKGPSKWIMRQKAIRFKNYFSLFILPFEIRSRINSNN